MLLTNQTSSSALFSACTWHNSHYNAQNGIFRSKSYAFITGKKIRNMGFILNLEADARAIKPILCYNYVGAMVVH